MTDSLMYKASFYDFGYVMTEQGKPQGYDLVRNKQIARAGYELDHLQEAFTR
jgi:dolichyl-diphosphooligosaccharide--protein glycosyltransferase